MFETYVNFCIYNIYKTAENDYEVEHIPRIPKVVLKRDWLVQKVRWLRKRAGCYTLNLNAANLNTNSNAKIAVKIMFITSKTVV